MGIIFFDLGGIDNLNTPSIASFKLGMNPETYSTVGEFIKVL
jgi:lipid II:glycine glycyltransferase (peptidoglycan interpeptide bridge formation enzyme)